MSQDCSEIRDAGLNELGLLSTEMMWTFKFELRNTLSISVTTASGARIAIINDYISASLSLNLLFLAEILFENALSR